MTPEQINNLKHEIFNLDEIKLTMQPREVVDVVIDMLATRGYLGQRWRPISEAPKDGSAFYVRYAAPFRWKPYSPKSQQFKSGKKGRWQEMNDYGGWDNTENKPTEWMSREEYLQSAPPQTEMEG